MKRGEVWLVDFSPKVGSEIDKIRPAIIVNHDNVGVLPLKIVVPVTHHGNILKQWHVPISPSNLNGLTKESKIDCFQVKSLSEQRFVRKLGILSTAETNKINIQLMLVLGLL